MIIIPEAKAMQAFALRTRQQSRRIGFVPTMGFLHEGHMSLVRIARKRADVVVLSSFVNPTQFGPREDFSSYPRNAERDDGLCEQEGVDVVFRPAVSEVYTADHSVYVDEAGVSGGLCGAMRPGHFRGVLTVVAKLFNLVQPDVAVFGRKDAQQARLIEKLVSDLNFPVEIVVAPIVREPDGLAMSSRNTYLSADERRRALALHGALCLVRTLHGEGVREVATLKDRLRLFIEEKAAPVVIEYIEMVDYRTFKPVERVEGVTLVALAVRIGKTRLIDNAVLPDGD